MYGVFVVWCVFYPYSCSQFELATFQMLRSHLWPAAAVLGSAGLAHGSCFADSGLEQLGLGLVPLNVECLPFFLKAPLGSHLYCLVSRCRFFKVVRRRFLHVLLPSFLPCLLGIGRFVAGARGWLGGAKSLSSPTLTGL